MCCSTLLMMGPFIFPPSIPLLPLSPPPLSLLPSLLPPISSLSLLPLSLSCPLYSFSVEIISLDSSWCYRPESNPAQTHRHTRTHTHTHTHLHTHTHTHTYLDTTHTYPHPHHV